MATVQRLYIQNASGGKTYLDAHSVNGVPAGTIATNSTLGMSKIGDGLSITTDGKLSVDGSVAGSTQIATKTTAGVVKVGAGLSITTDGTLSSDVTNLPVATVTTVGVVRPGTGLNIATDGTLTTVKDIASPVQLGQVMIGDGLAVTTSGVLSADPKIASNTQIGVVKIGKNINVTTSGEISVDDPKIATTTTLGEVIVGSGLMVDGNGKVTLDLPIASETALGGVQVGDGLTATNVGVLSTKPATATTIGGVIIGDNVDVAHDGTISIKKADANTFGVVQIGEGLSIGDDGKLNVDAAAADDNKQDSDKYHNKQWMTNHSSTVYLSTLNGASTSLASVPAYFGILADLYDNKTTDREDLRIPYEEGSTATLFDYRSADKVMYFWLPKQGSVLKVDYSGATAAYTYTSLVDFMSGDASIDTASKSAKGIVQIGDNIDVDTNGVVSVPVATATTLGAVQGGDRITVDASGNISADIATTAVAGTVLPNSTDFSLNETTGLLKVNTSSLVAQTDDLPVKSSAVSAALGDYNHDWVTDFENALV